MLCVIVKSVYIKLRKAVFKALGAKTLAKCVETSQTDRAMSKDTGINKSMLSAYISSLLVVVVFCTMSGFRRA